MSTRQILCNTCGKPIEEMGDGWIEWIELHNGMCGEFRICHHPSTGCALHEERARRKDHHIEVFLGRRGLVILMELLERGCYDGSIASVILRLHCGSDKTAGEILGDEPCMVRPIDELEGKAPVIPVWPPQ